jgi:hypothetical protein
MMKDEVIDPFSSLDKTAANPDELAAQAEAIQLAALRAKPREAAIEHGRQLGEDEANKRNETGEERDNRIKRAMAYAAWEYDGRPLGHGDRYQTEFSLGATGELQQHLQRGGPDLKRNQKK